MITDNDKTVLQFSGGKDSLACLYLLRPHWPQLTVVWVNTGAAYPETVALMDSVRAMVPNFLEIKSDQPAQIAQFGPPADILPVRSSAIGRLYTQSGAEPIQSFLECCSANIWRPMAEAFETLGVTLIIRGQKLSDDRKTALRSGHIEAGVRYWFPIEDWSDEEVISYLAEIGVPLPAHYAYTKTSLDCWSCTAYADENQGRIAHMRAHEPGRWAQFKPQVERILRASEPVTGALRAMLGAP